MRRSKLTTASALSLASALLLAGAGARADDLDSLLEEQVVSTASKSLETAAAAPATSTIITAEDLQRYGIRSLDEAINFLGMGMVVENPLHDLEIGARGAHFTRDYGDHVLLLVNGHALNEQWGGAAYFERGTAIPFELIDHIEVILGPGSVLYGSEAMLGVVNIVTKRAKDWQGAHAVVESEVPVSIRVAAGVGHEFHVFGKPAEVTLELEYFAQNGPAFTLGPQFAPGYGGTPVRYTIGGPKDSLWGGTASQSNYAQIPAGYLRAFIGDFEINVRSASFKRGVVSNSYTFDDPGTYEIDRWLSADVRHRWVLSKAVDLSSRLYADSYDYIENFQTADGSGCLPGMPNGCLYQLVGASKWVGLEEQLTVDWAHDGTIFTLIGVDGRIKHVGSKTDYFELVTDRTPGSFGVTDLTEKALGIYGQQIFKPWRPLAINGGVRVDIDDRFGAHASPRVAIAVTPWEGATIKGIYSEAFRAPTAYERYYADPTGQIPAPNLGPETVESLEATFDQRIKGQHLFVGGFRTVYNSLVEYETLSQAAVAAAIASGLLAANKTSASQYQNVATVDTWGFNAGFEGAALSTRLHYGATFTGAQARQHGTGEIRGTPLVVAPSVSGNARVAYDLGGYLPTVALASRFVGRRAADLAYTLPPVYSVEPYAPLLVELRLTLSGKVPKVRGLSYRATANVVTTSSAPYVIGPGTLANGMAELMPVDQFRTGVGLTYNLPF